MEYCKPHLSHAAQAALLIRRGLVADFNLLVSRLKDVGYCRLRAYMHPFRKRNSKGEIEDSFVHGTTLDKVWLHYRFDRKLRFLLIDAIERIEVALRSNIAYHHTKDLSPFAYASPSYFPKWKGYMQGLERVRIRKDRLGNTIQTGNDAVDHFFFTYGDKHEYLPLWLAVNEMEFGSIVYFYAHSDKVVRKAIAEEWKIDTGSLYTWLTSLRVLRNDCAHHARIWNKAFLTIPRMNNTPALPWDYIYSDKAQKWVKPVASLSGGSSMLQSQSSLAPLLFVCRHLIRQVAPTSQWHIRIQDFLLSAEQQGIPLRRMGLPEHWEQHPLWV